MTSTNAADSLITSAASAADTGAGTDISPTDTPRRFRRVAGVVGVAYTASWIAGLSVWPNNLKANADGAEILAAFGGHRTPALLNYAFTEGLPAIGLAVVGLALAAAARRADQPGRARVIAATAVAAALISVTQFVLGAILTVHTVPSGSASGSHLLFELLNRLDGVKMFTLAALAAAGSAVGSRWLRWTAYALAVTIIGSGIGYLFLLTGLTTLAFVSGPLLLVWITGSGIAQSRRTPNPRTQSRTAR